MLKSSLGDTNVNKPVPSSINDIRPVMRERTPADPPAMGHVTACSMTTDVDSLRHLFKSSSASVNVDAMCSLIDFVIHQKVRTSAAKAINS